MSTGALMLPASLRDEPAIEVEFRMQVLVVPGKCDMPPLAMMAPFSFRPLMICASALPSASQRFGRRQRRT
jgi:hypothetical protein